MEPAALATAAVARWARGVLQAFSSSFSVVTRFLPSAKRAQVELIDAAVRYPDEIVDTFPLSPPRKLALLDAWSESYECALLDDGLRASVGSDVPCFALHQLHRLVSGERRDLLCHVAVGLGIQLFFTVLAVVHQLYLPAAVGVALSAAGAAHWMSLAPEEPIGLDLSPISEP